MAEPDSTPPDTSVDIAAPGARTWAAYVQDHPNVGLEGVEAHPAADLFPMMPDSELDDLAKDIAKPHGLQNQLVWLDGRLLDGRNRLAAITRIADKARREPLLEYAIHRGLKKTGLSDAQAEEFAISVNLHRRHLTAEQRREFVVARLKAHPEKSDRSIAKEAGVDKNTVTRNRQKLEHRGLVVQRTTRTDARGRQQPASKPLLPKTIPMGPVSRTPIDLSGPIGDVSYKPLDLGQPLPQAKQSTTPATPPPKIPVVANERADTMSRFSALLMIDTKGTLAQLVRTIKFAKPAIEALTKEERAILLRGFQQALRVTDDDLRPVTDEATP
jgi:hypothetical protein